MLSTDEWQAVDRVGYLGNQRDARFAIYDIAYGSRGNWALGWKVGDLWVGYAEACALYEDAYMEFLRKHPAILVDLVHVASNVYDDAPSNVDSHFNYAKQETTRTHIQDIAIRRCLLRNGIWFKGQKLLQIRDHLGTHPLSMALSPGQVPFHLPHILEPALDMDPAKKWWKAGSVEDFYQRNRYLMERKQP